MLKLDIQMFADGKVVIDTKLNTSDFENGLDKMKNQSERAGSTIKNIVAGLGITKIITKGIDTINASVDSAIARVDTLNNFPKVMSNLGVGAEESTEAISKMSDKLAGLPTTLDQGASAVQRFTSKNGDVKKSTDIFLALNNAILAGGASTDIQATALEQLSQSYAKGKPDMMEWRSAMTAMPAQLKQVATAMGYIDTDELGEDLRKGVISMDDFMDTIVELNSKGVDGFQSFEEQARNSTGGIGTAITVAKTQIVKGVADMITSLNSALEEADLPNITEIIQNIGIFSKQILDTVAEKLPAIIEFLKMIVPILVPILAGITAFKIIGTIISLINGAKVAILALNLAMAANPIGVVIGLITALVATFVYLWNTSEDFRKFWIGLWEGIKSVINSAINIVKERVKGFINGIVEIFNVGKKIYNMGKNIVTGLWEGISGSFDWIKNKIKGWVGNVMNFFKKVFGIHSPSTLMRDEIGKYLAEGMGVGFENELDDVYNKMQNAIDLETEKMSANVQTSGTYQMAMAGLPEFNLVDNTNNTTQLVVNGKVLAEVVNTENKNREVARA